MYMYTYVLKEVRYMYIHVYMYIYTSYMYFRRKDRAQFYNCNIHVSFGTGYSIEAFYDFNDYPQACSH